MTFRLATTQSFFTVHCFLILLFTLLLPTPFSNVNFDFDKSQKFLPFIGRLYEQEEDMRDAFLQYVCTLILRC